MSASFRLLTHTGDGPDVEYIGQSDIRWEFEIAVERPDQDKSPYTVTLKLWCDPATESKVIRKELEPA